MGYALQHKGEGLNYQGAQYDGILEASGGVVHAEWNGLRLGLSVAINITGLKKGGE